MKRAKKGWREGGDAEFRELEDLKGPEYAYLGHMAKKEFQCEGHNFMPRRKKTGAVLDAVSRGLSLGTSIAARLVGKSKLGVPQVPEQPYDLQAEMQEIEYDKQQTSDEENPLFRRRFGSGKV